jgi:hypothetical protein
LSAGSKANKYGNKDKFGEYYCFNEIEIVIVSFDFGGGL